MTSLKKSDTFKRKDIRYELSQHFSFFPLYYIRCARTATVTKTYGHGFTLIFLSILLNLEHKSLEEVRKQPANSQLTAIIYINRHAHQIAEET